MKVVTRIVGQPRTRAERLMALRINAGLTTRELAKMGGISASSISRYENGLGDLTFASAATLARALGVSLDYIAFGKGHK